MEKTDLIKLIENNQEYKQITEKFTNKKFDAELLECIAFDCKDMFENCKDELQKRYSKIIDQQLTDDEHYLFIVNAICSCYHDIICNEQGKIYFEALKRNNNENLSYTDSIGLLSMIVAVTSLDYYSLLQMNNISIEEAKEVSVDFIRNLFAKAANTYIWIINNTLDKDDSFAGYKYPDFRNIKFDDEPVDVDKSTPNMYLIFKLSGILKNKSVLEKMFSPIVKQLWDEEVKNTKQ